MKVQRVLALGAVTAVLFAACSSDDDSTSADQPPATSGSTQTEASAPKPEGSSPPSDACDGVTLSFLGLAGEEGEAELADWRAEHDVTIQVNNISDFSQAIASIQAGDSFDLMTMPFDQAQQMVLAGILEPLDTSTMSNWSDMVAGLQQTADIRDADGNVYGAPIAWGDGPFVYNPANFTPPEDFSILELTKPEWKGRFALFDSPGRTFYFVGKALGFDAPYYTEDEFEQVKSTVADLVANAAGFASNYKDGTAKLVAGDIDLLINGWQSQLPDAESQGVPLDFSYFAEGRTGWWDGLAIPTTASNPECAALYINQMISPETQLLIANNLVSGVVNTTAIDQVTGITKDFYDYAAVADASTDAFEKMTPPDELAAGVVPFQAWLDAWQEIKAG